MSRYIQRDLSLASRVLVADIGGEIGEGAPRAPRQLDVLAHRPSGTPVHVGEFDDADEEARAVAGEANWLMEHAGVPFGSMAVLYRTNRQAREIESALAMHGAHTPWPSTPSSAKSGTRR